MCTNELNPDEEINPDKVDGAWITLLARWFAKGATIGAAELPYSSTLPWGGVDRPWQNDSAWAYTHVDRTEFLKEIDSRFGPNP